MFNVSVNTRLISKIRADWVEIKNQLTEKYVSVVSNIYITALFYSVVTIIFKAPWTPWKMFLKLPAKNSAACELKIPNVVTEIGK